MYTPDPEVDTPWTHRQTPTPLWTKFLTHACEKNYLSATTVADGNMNQSISPVIETVNTVCLGFSSVQSVMVLSMVFGEDEGFWWRRQRIFGEDYGFLVKITDFFISSMFTLHTNEGGACTEQVHTY